MHKPERILTISNDDDGQRLDRWLKKNVPDMPYGLVQKLIRKGAIRLDGKKVKAEAKLGAGQEIRIPAYDGAKEKDKKKISDKDAQFIKSLILFEDAHIIALNKPPGLAVQGGTKTKKHIDGLLQALANKEGVVPRLVHRLDKDTSGVLLLARSAKVAKQLGQMFKERDIRKLYWALVFGIPDPQEGTIKAALTKAGGANKERMIIDDEEGKSAVTEYAVIDFAHRHASFVGFWPRTGRTHQIRAHAEILGTPIVGDRKYNGRQLENRPEPIQGVRLEDGMHLHARQLTFKHPVTHKWMFIRADLPQALKNNWKLLGFNPNDKSDPFETLES